MIYTVHKECEFSKCSCFYFSKKALGKKNNIQHAIIQEAGTISEVLLHL